MNLYVPAYVTYQTIEQETIILNLENGIYYSTNGPGALIWESIAQGIAAHEIAAQLARRYRGDLSTFSAAVTQFISELQQEGLLIPVNNHRNVPAQTNLDELFPLPVDLTFEPVVLQKYTDMQDLLLLDPIHEVDENGWPLAQDQDT